MTNPTIMLSLESAGDLTPDTWDRSPTSIPVQTVRYSKSVPVPKGVQGPYSLGTKVPIPVSEHVNNPYIEVDFPEEELDERPYSVVAENDIDVPEELLIEVNESIADNKDRFKHTLLTITGMLMGHEDASIFMETALRDGLGIDIEVDQGIQEAFTPLSRLVILTDAIQRLNLPKVVSNTLLNKLANKFGDEIVASTNKKKHSDTLQQLHKLYSANITKAGIENDVPDNTLGTRTSRR